MNLYIAILILVSISTAAESIGRQEKKEIEVFAKALKGKRYTTKIYLARYAERDVTRVRPDGTVTCGTFQIKPIFGQTWGEASNMKNTENILLH